MTPLFVIYFFIFIIGAGIGSFLNVCISRIPNKKSIVFPPSICANCGKKVKPYDNIPIISYLILRGKCRFCSEKIPIHHFIVEIVTPLLYILIFTLCDNQFSFLFFKYIFFISVCIIIFFIDFKHKIIPNILTLPLIVIGFGLVFFKNNDVSYISSLIGAGFGFLLFWGLAVLFYRVTNKEGLGGGDIKLITAIGAFIGFYGTLFVILSSSFLAIIIIVIFQRDKSKYFPYGPFLVLASMLYVFFGKNLIEYYLYFF
ncbi:MAG: prepilin peptidase [Candidatus Cloacimonadota bacterium]|nr:prepilin peptidase [Candidatus Cloacimonadota bacterium]